MSGQNNAKERLSLAFDEGDVTGCAAVLVAHRDLADGLAGDGLPYVRSALHRESHGQPLGVAQAFLDAGAHVDVFTAAAMGQTDRVIEYLQKDPAWLTRPDAWGMQPLHWAAHCGHTPLVAELLDRGANVNGAADSWTALHLAVELSHPETVRLLIDRGARLDARLDDEHDRMTPFEMAKAWNLSEMESLLRRYYD